MNVSVPAPPPALVCSDTNASAVRHSANRGRAVTSSSLSWPPLIESQTVLGAPANWVQ